MANPRAGPGVGIGVFLFKATGEFIVGKRKGSLGSGTYALPGGHLEVGESFETCSAREVFEETGITISEDDVKFLTCVNNVFPSGHHYVTIAMGYILNADVEPKNLEPEKCEGWEWITWEKLRSWVEKGENVDGPGKLFQPMIEFVTQRAGFDPFETYVAQKRVDRIIGSYGDGNLQNPVGDRFNCLMSII